MKLVPVDNLADPRLAPYANMRDAELAQRADPLDGAAHGGLFIAEGELVLRRLIASRFAVQSVLTTPTHVGSLGDALDGLDADVPVFVAEPRLLSEIVGFNMHRGVLGVGVRGPGLALADLISRPGPLVVLEDLVNHDNLGGVFRNIAALGGSGASVLLSPRCADPLYRKSLRVSMGTILSVPFARAEAWPGVLDLLANAGFDVWGLTPRNEATDIGEAVRTLPNGSKVALILGTEGTGMSEAALHACTRLVRIPMRRIDPNVDSLNVAVAAGIALHCLGGLYQT